MAGQFINAPSPSRREARNFENELDIVIVGNKSDKNVTSGQYVTVRDSAISGITNGIYKATANVAAGTAFVAANLSAVTSGALNDLNGNLANKDVTNDCTWNNGFSYAFRKVYECGQYYTVQISATSSAFVNGATIVTLPKAAACSQYMSGLIVASSGVPTGAVCVAMTSQGVKNVTVNISGAALNGYIVLALLIPKQ